MAALDRSASLAPPTIWDRLAQTWPAQLAQQAWGAFTLPGDVYAGRVDPNSPEAVNRAADMASLMAGGGTAGALAAGGRGAAPVLAAEVAGRSLEPAGIRAYHGSPYDFEKFDISKIGTGEGAQAYGHGLYFAGNQGVAEGYRKALSEGFDTTSAQKIARQLVKEAGGDWTKAATKFRDMIEAPKRAAESRGLNYQIPQWDQEVMGVLDHGRPGRTYEVSINAHPDEFLNWDKRLNEQTPQVQAALKQMMNPAKWDAFKNADVSTAVKNGLIAMDPGAQTSSALQAAGIKGIKYKDAGSRGTEGGTHNYVVFDPQIIDILRKYGIAGLTAGLGAEAVQPLFRTTPVDHDPFAAAVQAAEQQGQTVY